MAVGHCRALEGELLCADARGPIWSQGCRSASWISSTKMHRAWAATLHEMKNHPHHEDPLSKHPVTRPQNAFWAQKRSKKSSGRPPASGVAGGA
ncbi:unnamed protein product, partial [Amoebophrya sp. A120]|eukprot:GSA120T00009965001.1